MLTMAENIKYYAVLSAGRSLADPSGLARRTMTPDGRMDESLHRDLTWGRSSEIYQWERGENFGPDLVEISAEEAAVLVERFRQRWAE
jgi:hypothetical protein